MKYLVNVHTFQKSIISLYFIAIFRDVGFESEQKNRESTKNRPRYCVFLVPCVYFFLSFFLFSLCLYLTQYIVSGKHENPSCIMEQIVFLLFFVFVLFLFIFTVSYCYSISYVHIHGQRVTAEYKMLTLGTGDSGNTTPSSFDIWFYISWRKQGKQEENKSKKFQ